MDWTEEYIDQYLDNTLSPDEKAAFENKMLNDTELKSSVERQRNLREGIIVSGSRGLKLELDRIHDNMMNEAKQKTPPIIINKEAKHRSIVPKWLTLAASLLLFALAFWYFYPTNTDANSKDLFANNYLPYEIDLSQRGGNEDILIEKIRANYDSKNYLKTNELIDKLAKTSDLNGQMHIIKGTALLELNQYDKAIDNFQTARSKNGLFRNVSSWYEALIYLKKGDFETSKARLNSIIQNSKPKNPYHLKAKKLLKEMKQ